MLRSLFWISESVTVEHFVQSPREHDRDWRRLISNNSLKDYEKINIIRVSLISTRHKLLCSSLYDICENIGNIKYVKFLLCLSLPQLLMLLLGDRILDGV